MTFTLKRALGVLVFLVLAGLWIFFQLGDRPVEQPWNFLHQTGHHLITLGLSVWAYFERPKGPTPVYNHYGLQRWTIFLMMALSVVGIAFNLYVLYSPGNP
jgi:hypothetical protein